MQVLCLAQIIPKLHNTVSCFQIYSTFTDLFTPKFSSLRLQKYNVATIIFRLRKGKRCIFHFRKGLISQTEKIRFVAKLIFIVYHIQQI